MRRASRFSRTLQTYRRMSKRGSIVCKWRPCLPKGPTNSARMCTIVTAALQRQYLQTEIILRMRVVFPHPFSNQKIYFHVDEILTSFPVQRQMNPVHILQSLS